jgi:hypothetical protein
LASDQNAWFTHEIVANLTIKILYNSRHQYTSEILPLDLFLGRISSYALKTPGFEQTFEFFLTRETEMIAQLSEQTPRRSPSVAVSDLLSQFSTRRPSKLRADNIICVR